MSKQILVNSLILSFGILLGRFSGYLRELVIAYKYEVTIKADNIILMLSIPDLLNNLLVSGAITGIMIPLLSSNTGKINEIIGEFTSKLFYIVFILYIVLAVVLSFIFDFYLLSLLMISLLSIFPNILTFVSSSYLQYEKRFKKQSLNTLWFNIVIILFLLLGFYEYYFAIGVIVASLIRLIWVSSDLKFTSIALKSFFSFSKMDTISLKTLIFMIFANGLIFILPMIDKIFASFLTEGSVSILSYAEKVYLLPVSVFLTTYAVAMFPDLSKMVANGDTTSITKILKKSIGFNLLVSFFVVMFMFLYSFEMINLLYGFVGIGIENIKIIDDVFNGYLGALLLAGTNAILLNLFFANKLYNTLIIYSCIILSIKLLLNSCIVVYGFDIDYIAMGTSISILISVVLLAILYRMKIGIRK